MDVRSSVFFLNPASFGSGKDSRGVLHQSYFFDTD